MRLIISLIVWTLIRQTKPLTSMETKMDSKEVVDILVVGRVTVYTLQTKAEIKANTPYECVYWKDTQTDLSYGPFENIHAALMHRKYLVEQGVVAADPVKPEAQVIHIDFKTRKRVTPPGEADVKV